MSLPAVHDPTVLPHLRGLVEVLRGLRAEPAHELALPRVAEALAETLGFGSVALSLYRPDRDDLDVVASHGGPTAHALSVPMHAADGSLVGTLSVDGVPTADHPDLLALAAEHVALAIDAARAEAVAARDRAALAQLLEVSSRLAGLDTVESVLDAVTCGVQAALGFEKVVVAIADGAGGFVPRGAAGWHGDADALAFSLTKGDLLAILDPAFEIEGCYLCTNDEAMARVGNRSSHVSVRNGTGPYAWNRHWLIVPLYDRGGELTGFLWADDPEDCLLPSPQRLQALRTFANQASAAIRATLDLERLTRRGDELDALHQTTLRLLDRVELGDVLEAIVESGRSLLNTEHGYLYLADKRRDSLVLTIRLGLFERSPVGVVSRGEGVAGRVWETGESLVVDDYTHWEGRLREYEHAGFHAVLGVPLRAAHSIRGVLGVALDQDGRTFTHAEVALLERFAQLASLALENASLYAEAQREIEERRQAEEALRRNEELQRLVVENSTDVIMVFEPNGRIVFASPSVTDVLGYGLPELVGMNFRELVHAEDLGPMSDVIARSLAGESGLYPARIRHRDGRWVVLEGIPAAIRDAQGRVELILGIARDVTERRRADEERTHLEEQLRQAQKMESIGRLAGGIAHDFNNLLTAIGGYAELSLLDLDEPESVRENIEQIARASNRAASLTSQLLAYSRKQVLHPRLLDLNVVVEAMATMLRRMLGEHIVLSTELEPGAGRVLADPTQIEQVLLNLAVNARDAMPAGGTLALRTASLELAEDAEPRHRDVQPGSYVTLSVADSGPGIEPEVAERIFEPFFTTKAVGEGTGLGLATVQGIVTQSGGTIWVDSLPDAGACFTVCLPRVEAAQPAAQPR